MCMRRNKLFGLAQTERRVMTGVKKESEPRTRKTRTKHMHDAL